MKKILFLPLFLCALTAFAKSEKIPSYKSFVYWIQDADTIYEENNTLLQESVSPDGSVVVRVRHEDWKNTVTEKSIARLAPWHAVMSRSRGIRAIIHQGKSNTDAMMPMKKVPGMMPNALSINNLSRMTDEFDMKFACEYMIENTSKQEIVINDLNRGLVWYVPANSYLLLNMGTLPQACLLRIANTDPLQPSIKYVTIGSASLSMKFTVAYEDDDCWIYLINEEANNDKELLDFSKVMEQKDSYLHTIYIKRDKDSFQETPMVQEEVFHIIKTAKEEKERAKKNK